MKSGKTQRGFGIYEFKDTYGASCSIQKSSSAMEDRIWIGVDNADPKIMAKSAKALGIKTESENGWVSYPIPDDVLLSTRMHINQEQAKEIVTILQRFIETGEI